MAKKRASRKLAKPKKVARGTAPELQMLVLCDAAVRDPNSGKLTLYGLFDEFLPDVFPSKLTFFAYAKVAGGEGKHDMSFDFVSPDGKSLLSGKMPRLEIECIPSRKVDIVVQIGGIRVEKAGIYRLVVRCNNRKLGKSIDVPVSRKKETITRRKKK